MAKIKVISDEDRWAGFTNNIFQLIILPTRNCQCRCKYCYETHSNIYMQEIMFNSIVKLILKRKDFTQKFFITWFGGEPLLCKDKIINFLQILTSYNIPYISGISTNFINIDYSLFETFINLGLTRFQVTLDGDKEYHDKKRIFINGQGTYDVIMNNLKMIHKTSHDCQVLLRLHYHGNNLTNLMNLIDIVETEFSGDKRFGIYWKKISDEYFVRNPIPEVNKTELKLLDERIALSSQKPNVIVDDGICYASKANVLIVDVDGTIKKCSHHLDDPLNVVGKLDDDGELIINQNDYRKWIVFLLEKDVEGSACPFKKLKI